MLIRSARLLAAVAGLGVALPAAGQSIPWLNPVNGNWNEAAKWTGGNIPDAVGEIARLNAAGTYTVVQNVGGLTLSAINISAPNATLHVNGNSITAGGAAGLTNSGTVVAIGGNTLITGVVNNNAAGEIFINTNCAITVSGNLFNDGAITVNTTSNNSFTTTLVAAAPLVISGSGSMMLNGNGGAGQLVGPGTIENGASHLIRGRGQITAPLTNQGTVAADQASLALTLNTSPMTNNGMFRATNDAALAINSITVTQGASGVLEADDGSVNLSSATISGGTLTTANAGFLGCVSGTSTLIDVTNTGDLFINTNTAIALGGSTFVNSGTFVVNTTANNSFTTTLHALTPMLISGPGEIILNANGGAAQITSAGGVSITQASDHTIHGRGQIVAPMVNNGLVNANVNGGTMALNSNAKTNNAEMVASNNGVMAISSIAINQSASGLVSADGGFVDLSSATINGGDIEGVNGGRLRGVNGTQTLNNVDFVGALDIHTNTAVSLAGGAFTNNGSVLVNTQANNSFPTTLVMSGDVAIDGVGEIILNALGAAAQITGNTLTLGADQVVHGRGQIVAPMVNNGLVHANVNAGTMALNSNPKANNAEIVASNNGVLSVAGIAINQSSGAVVSANGGFVDLSSAAISGGTVEAVNGGRIRGVSGTQTLTDVDLVGPLDINTNTAVALAGGAFTNNGSVLVNAQANNSFTTTLVMSGDMAIDGTGEIVLNANVGAAQITGNTLTLGSGQTLHGRGQIVAPMVNNGLVHANVAGGAMAFHSNGKTNNAVMRASGTGVLAISAITVTQSPTGLIEADNGFVDMTSAAVTGGSMDTLNGGAIRSVSGTQTLTGVALSGQVDINANTAIALAGSMLNDGTIRVNTTANNSFTTTLQMNGAVSVDGTGVVLLNANAGAAQITQSGGGSLAMGPGQTLKGTGNISAPITTSGTIAPGLSIGTLNVPAPSTLITYQPGSTLDVELGSASSYDRIAGGSHTINGGTVNVTLTGGYSPALFTKHTIIDGSGGSVVAGRFDGVTGPALPSPWVWRVGYTAQDVIVGVSCPADMNADFIVDIVDFLDFLDAFGACENQPAPCGSPVDADYNGDTFVDILDFLDFFDAFGSGC